MKSRKEKKLIVGNSKKVKFLIGTVLLSAGIGSSVSVAFADQDINALLTNWFDKKKTESISEIEQAVMTEKEIQKQRLKEQLQLEIQESEKELQVFTHTQKEQRVLELQRYTVELIANLDIDNSSQEQKITEELNVIVQEAIEKMNSINKETKQPVDSKENQGNHNGQDNNKDSVETEPSQGNSNENKEEKESKKNGEE